MVTKLNKKIKIFLTGGGTGGSVSPLLAVREELEKKGGVEFLWLGTKNGIEKEMVKKAGIEFRAIVAGKFRRYCSWKNLLGPFLIIIGFFQSLWIILRWRPALVMSAGSFVSVPAVWAAWFLGVPVLIHQQDARPGLANRLMAPFANVITVTFKESLKSYGKKAVWTGNPVRRSLTDDRRQTTDDRLKLRADLPVLLVVGGGTGAAAINKLVWAGLDDLTKICQVIHITGKNKIPNYELHPPAGGTNYEYFEFLEVEKWAAALRLADVVISRAGLGLLTELSYLAKPTILIPLPDSHQEDNARIFKERGAALVLDQRNLTASVLVDKVKKLLADNVLRSKLRNNINKVIKRGANEKMVKIVKEVISKK